MSFDAGAVIARVEVDEGAFNASIDRVEARLNRLAGKEYHIKVVADYDAASTERIRRAFSDLDQRITRDMVSRQRTGAGGSVFGMLNGLFSRGAARDASQAAGQAGGGLLGNLGSAAGPGIMGIGAKPALIGAAIPVVGAALPSLFGVAGTAAGGGLGLGVAGLLGMQAAAPATALAQARSQAQAAQRAAVTPAQQQAAAQQMQAVNQQVAQLSPALHSIFTSISQIQTWWQNFTKSLAPLLAPALHEIVPMITSLGAPIKSMFAGAMTIVVPFMRALTSGLKEILPLLGQMFRASAPGFATLTTGLLVLVRNILPGLTTLIKATAPAMGMFARTLGSLGTDLGKMFAIMAPAVKPSMIVLDSLLKLVGALMPVIGRLAVVFADALAPVFVVFAGVIKALLPTLVILGRILGEFGGAVLVDLLSLLKPIAILLRDLNPSFLILAGVLGRVFTVLENTGVFQVLANALYRIVPVMAQLINEMVRQLAPYLPLLITLISQLASILVDLLAAGMEALLIVVLGLITHFRWLLPLIVGLWAAFKGYTIIKDAIGAVRLFASESVLGAVKTAAAWVVSSATIVASFVAQAAAATAAFIAENLATLGIIAGIALLVAAVIFLATHWHRVWSDIRNWAEDAWKFLTHGWGQFIILPLYGIRKAVEFVRDHWKQAWDDIKGAAQDAWNFISHIGSVLASLMTRTLPNAFGAGATAIGDAWQKVSDLVAGPAKWVVNHVVNGLASAYNWVASHVGAPQIPNAGNIHPFGLQKGGKMPGYGGGDILPALLEPGETVVSKEHSKALAGLFAAMGVPGYTAGGKVGQNPPHPGGGFFSHVLHDIGSAISGVFNIAKDGGKAVAAIGTGNQIALTNALSDMFAHGSGGALADFAKEMVDIPAHLLASAVHNLLGYGGGGLGGRGAEIAKYAMSFAGKIPYVWGGTAVPGGADCSGFIEAIYRHFGISAPRTSEAQGQWVKRSPAEIGGLAFYNSPAGGPPPGHVAMVGFNGNVISQGGGMGPQIEALRSAGQFMFTGIPPGGGAGYGPGNLRGLESIWQAAGGGGGSTAHIAAAIAMAESGGREVKQQGEPAGLTGWGLWQITPTSGIWNNGRFGNLLNDANNARAAVYLWRNAGGFSPWATFNSGAYQRFMDGGGWLMPGATVALNQTGMREAVLQPRESQAFTMLAHAAHGLMSGGGGRGGGGRGQIAEVMNIMLPEGTTLAQMMAELVFRVKSAELAGTAGAIR